MFGLFQFIGSPGQMAGGLKTFEDYSRLAVMFCTDLVLSVVLINFSWPDVSSTA
jgi:hypothetical protein